ncbi:hypothetical protein C6496_13785 [Candidatus Poribacteria bacterium]|nr:MAG: hypothetical protein C6496_13785 [Candidatus Poribacteria bacterium]
MFRRFSLLTLIVCLLSLFLIQHVSYADIPDSVLTEILALDNTKELMNITEGNYSTLKSAMDTLISGYKSNKAAVRNGTDVTVTVICGGIISAGVAIASGGSLAPAAFAAVVAANTAAKTAATSWKSRELVHAMGITLSAMDGALTDVNKAYNGDGKNGEVSLKLYVDGALVTRKTIGYKARYKAYLTECAKHINQEYSWLDTAVNMDGNAQVDSHTYLFRLHYNHWDSEPLGGYSGYRWNTVALPKDYRCEGGGTCYVMFRSPHEAFTAHKQRCQFKHTFTGLIYGEKREFQCILYQFVCNPNDDNHVHDFNPGPPTYPDGYSNESSSTTSASLSPSGGSYTASAGSTHTADVSVPSGYQYVYWYVKSPSESGLGTNVETDTGTGSTTSASFSYTFPSDASGDYVITAYTYLSDWSVVEPNYTVSVSSSSTDTTTTDTSSTTDDDDDDDTDSDSDTDDDDSSTASTSPYSLSASSTGSPFQAGDTVTLTLSGNESYYSVSWEVDLPGSTSSSYLSYESGGHGSYDSSTSYTFPSGYRGDFVFKAIVYTQGNMTRYEHTYTITVQ